MTEREKRMEMLHRLWTKAVGTPGYDKKEWQEFERLALALPQGEENPCAWCGCVGARCTAMSPDGIGQCGLRAGHKGMHSANDGYVCTDWGDDPCGGTTTEAERDAALARAEKAVSSEMLTGACDDYERVRAYGEGLYSQKCAAEAREAELRARVEEVMGDLYSYAPRHDEIGTWSAMRKVAARLRALLAPAGEASPPPRETQGPRVTDPAGAPTMPCPHHPPCPLPGTRYGEGYCVARSQHGKEPTDGR